MKPARFAGLSGPPSPALEQCLLLGRRPPTTRGNDPVEEARRDSSPWAGCLLREVWVVVELNGSTFGNGWRRLWVKAASRVCLFRASRASHSRLAQAPVERSLAGQTFGSCIEPWTLVSLRRSVEILPRRRRVANFAEESGPSNLDTSLVQRGHNEFWSISKNNLLRRMVPRKTGRF